MTARVFVVNEPTKLDPITGTFSRFMDLTTAEKYGDLVHLLPNGRISVNSAEIVKRLEDGLRDFGEKDLLLPIGDMTAITIAASIAAMKTDGHFNVLRWNPKAARYAVVRVELLAA